MPSTSAWPAAALIMTPRLQLEPLRVEHAAQAVTVLDDPRLHEWTGGEPCTLRELEAKYLRQSAGRSPDGEHGWLNWILRRLSDGHIIGTVQATLSQLDVGFGAELAWVIGRDHQSNGHAREAATAMVGWLRMRGVVDLTAHIHPQHEASNGIARAIGLTATNMIADGEVLWKNAAVDSEPGHCC